ncbi:MAG: InlB B-repeat-containing protein [Firmicutes bacterium]|nr:InlB B-repeat-containing protein [Bacillota bacterium]
MKKRHNLVLSFVICSVIAMVITGIMAGVPRQNIALQASVNWQETDFYVHRISDDALFGHEDSDWGAGINPVVAQQLLEILRSPELVAGLTPGVTGQARDAGHFSGFATSPSIVTQPNGAIYLRLFDELPSTVTTEVSGNETTLLRAFTNSIRGTGIVHQSGGARWWQLVYLQDGILTLWMVDPYRNSLFNEVGPINDINSHVYWHAERPSIIRENMVADFDAVLGYFDHLDIASAIVPTNNVVWQQERHNTHSRMENESQNDRMSNPGVPQNDLIWLPNWYEIFNTSYDNRFHAHAYIGGVGENARSGQWNMNSFDRGYAIVTNFSSTSWLRSAHLASENRTGAVSNIGNRTMPNSYDSARAVRPAIHLDVRSLMDALATPTGFSISRTQENQLTATWGTVNNAVSYRVRVGTGTWQTVNAPTTTFAHTITATGTFNFEIYAVGDGINYVNSTIASASITVNKNPLVTPTNLQISAGVLSWDTTGSLGTYVVYRNNVAYSTELTTTSWLIPTTWAAGTWNLQVRATAPASHAWRTDSDLSVGTNHVVVQTWTVTTVVEGIQTSHTITDGDQFTEPSPPAAPSGQHFVYWALGSLSGAEFNFGTAITGHIYLFAVFAPNTYVVTIIVDGVSKKLEPTGIINLATFAPTPPAGYTFSGWALSEGGTVVHTPDGSITLTGDLTLYAIFIPQNVGGNGGNNAWMFIAAAGVLLIAAVAITAVFLKRRKNA